MGLRRGGHDHRHVDRAQPDLHLRAAGHLPGALHGDRPERGVGDRERPGRGHERRRVPAEQRPVRRVRGRLARHQPLADHPAGRHASADRLGRQPQLPDRRRLALRAGHVGQEHHRPAAAERRRRGDGEDHDRPAHRELPAGRPARLPGRQQLGLGPHDLRGREPRLRVHLRERRQPAQRDGRQARRHPGRRSADLLGQADLGRLDAARRVHLRRRRLRPRRPAGGHLRLVGPAGRAGGAVRHVPTFPVARFDWIRFNPDSSGGGGGGGGGGNSRSPTTSTAPRSAAAGTSCARTSC